jgi:hypothetical protein
MTVHEFLQKQSLPYEAKIAHAEIKARDFYETVTRPPGEGIRGYDANCHVSVGGLDSITLFIFLHSIGINVPGISVSSLEDKSIRRVHESLGIEKVKPLMKKTSVIKEFGFPVISKAKASKIEYLQSMDSPKQTFIHAIMTGQMGKQGNFEKSEKIKLPDKWIKLFGGFYADKRPDITCKSAPFKVSAKCCYWLKEAPCDNWAKENNSYPYLGLMASEGGQREQGLMKNGCNYYGKSTVRSCPFAIFTRQDLLRLAVDLRVPIPEIYGEIKEKPDGTLYTTKAQRTGCTMCGFGIHIEKRPHRFDRLKESNLKEWMYWMYDIGWGKVLDWIGVEWENPVGAMHGQMSLLDLEENHA